MSGFLEDLPDLGLPETITRRKKKPVKDEDGIDVVYYVKVRCPFPGCGSEDCPVYSSEPPIRYHKCRKCGHNFKYVEQK